MSEWAAGQRVTDPLEISMVSMFFSFHSSSFSLSFTQLPARQLETRPVHPVVIKAAEDAKLVERTRFLEGD